jgi:hypothetical protein
MTLVTLTTDFGTTDPFAGIMKGVIASRAPQATVVDVTHGIPPQDILAGALVLRHTVPYFPAGTVHVAVVDPGVGGDRRPLCVETAAGFLVGPDNGLLSLAAVDVRRIVHLVEERFFLTPRSATFHGRDVFAPVAAALAAGAPATDLGPIVPDMIRIEVPAVARTATGLRGEVVYVDHFGNLVTNVDAQALAAFSRRTLSISIGARRVGGVAPSYASVARGEFVAVVNSWGLVEVAVRDGSAAALLGARPKDPVTIEE